MFCKATYWNSIYTGTTRDPETVAADFISDAARLVPISVTENQSRVFVSFREGPTFTAYYMPISYKTYVSEV